MGIEFHNDCRYWEGYRPCINQKQGLSTGCDGCSLYSPISDNYLIIEAGGLGSILRTSVLSKELKRQNPASQVQWLTHPSGQELLKNIPSVDGSINSEDCLALIALQGQTFTHVFNFESAPLFLSLTNTLKASQKTGFYMNEVGKLIATEDAEYFQRLQVNDNFRSIGNQKSMQQIILETAGMTWEGQNYDLSTNPIDDVAAQQVVRGLGLPDRPLVGLNIGSSAKHNAKQWPIENFYQLAKINPGNNHLVLAGPEEESIYTQLL